MIQSDKNMTFIERCHEWADQLRKGKSPDWLRELRQQGWDCFERLGIPSVKDEEWKYTNIRPALDHCYALFIQPQLRAVDALPGYRDEQDINIVFVNGQLSRGLSNMDKPPLGMTVATLTELLTAKEGLARALWTTDHVSQPPAFVALNEALAGDGVYIEISDKVATDQVIHIIHLTSASREKVLTAPRTLIRLGKSSEATILESHVALNDHDVYFTVPLTDIFLADNAICHYTKAQKESLQAYHVGTTRVWQKRDSSFDGFSVVAGAAITRNNLDVAIDGEGATASLNGLYSIYKDQHVDNHTAVDHRQPNATSNQLYKGILNDAAHAVFNGKIFVRQIAQQTNSYQLNKNLLLGKECRIDTKPQLEIFADNVKCTHGATIGQLDEDEIFYLRSRAISRKEATQLLLQGFVDDLVGRLSSASVGRKVSQLLAPSLEAVG